jgi:tetratricopeptide (TPR) repeat protein
MDYTKSCFVIMPYGRKKMEIEPGKSREVDFDRIYETIFEPAIRRARLPEGGKFEPRRCDKDTFEASITQDMFEYLEYSRLAVADITGLNANVMYELGVRHRARPAGTIIFRQTAAPVPFDIKSIRAFAYDFEPADQAAVAVKTLDEVLAETMRENRLDSPVQQALLAQHNIGMMDALLRQAEGEVRNQQWVKAQGTYRQALALQPTNSLVRTRLGLLLKDQGAWSEALQQFEQAVADAPLNAAAQRELGVTQNKHQGKTDPDAGVRALRRAIELDPTDYDALASLGGIYKRQKNYAAALELYRRATAISRGASYPLLNALKLDARIVGKLVLDEALRFQLRRAERGLAANVARQPPFDPPWSFFDLAECHLYAGNTDAFLRDVEAGLDCATAAWQAQTFRGSLALLVEGGVVVPGLAEGLALIERREAFLP